MPGFNAYIALLSGLSPSLPLFVFVCPQAFGQLNLQVYVYAVLCLAVCGCRYTVHADKLFY